MSKVCNNPECETVIQDKFEQCNKCVRAEAKAIKREKARVARAAAAKARKPSRSDNTHLLDAQGRVKVGMGLARLSQMDRVKWLQSQHENVA